MLQMIISLKSSLPFQTPLGSSSFFGTTQLSPSSGKQSNIPFEKGRYGTSHSSNKLSNSPSLLPTSPKVLTKCPSGYLEVIGHLSMDTRNF